MFTNFGQISEIYKKIFKIQSSNTTNNHKNNSKIQRLTKFSHRKKETLNSFPCNEYLSDLFID